MNRLNKRIIPFRLNNGETIFLRPLSAKQRLDMSELHGEISRQPDGPRLRLITEKLVVPFVGKALLTESGERLYADDKLAEILDDFTGEELDLLQVELLRISGMGKRAEEAIKNLEPGQSAVTQ